MQEQASSLNGVSVYQTKLVLLRIQQVPTTHFNRKIWLAGLFQRLHHHVRFLLSPLGVNVRHIQVAFQTPASECKQILLLAKEPLWHGDFKNQLTITINTNILTKYLCGVSQTNNHHYIISKQ